MASLILIAEDEPAQTEVLRYNLDKAGYEVISAADGEEALLLAEERQPALILLDWMMPQLSGIEVCRRLREKKSTHDIPIIMITARGEEADRVRGLESGADDYVVKPYSPNEMVARVKAVLRRSGGGGVSETLQAGALTMDMAAHKVRVDGKKLKLGPTEYRLLHVLMEKPGRVFSREQLLDKAWGRDVYVEERTVDVHVRRLRKALEDAGAGNPIRTVRSAGYALEVED